MDCSTFTLLAEINVNLIWNFVFHFILFFNLIISFIYQLITKSTNISDKNLSKMHSSENSMELFKCAYFHKLFVSMRIIFCHLFLLFIDFLSSANAMLFIQLFTVFRKVPVHCSFGIPCFFFFCSNVR